MKEKIKERLIEWTVLIDPFPMPFHNVWEVKVEGKTIKIEASNRVFAYLKVKVKYPKAKNIRVVKRLKSKFHLWFHKIEVSLAREWLNAIFFFAS